MSKETKIRLMLLAMFIIVQLLGLYVIQFYVNSGVDLPYGFGQNAVQETQNPSGYFIFSFIFSFVIAIALILFLMKMKSNFIIKTWFFIVVSLAMGITFNVFLNQAGVGYASSIGLVLGVLLGYLKIYKRDIRIHNLTELIIYPGIGAIFALMFNIWTAVIILILFSIYDMWAVWKSGFMMKMVSYQMNTLGVLGGIMIPYASKKIKQKIELLKLKYKNHKIIPASVLKRQGIKIRVAVLGGGDLFFPLILTGAFYIYSHNMLATLIVSLFGTLSLVYLFANQKKGKAYPALPYLSVGLFLGILVAWLLIKFAGL